MAKKNQAEEIDPKIAAMLGASTEFDSDALEKAGYVSHNVNAFTLPEGKQVKGKLVGTDSYEVTDQKTKELKTVQTYEIKTANGNIVLNGAAMLDRLMKKVRVGSEVVIARFENSESNSGNEMGVYKVFAK